MPAGLPEIVYHMYWLKKNKFLLEKDIYVTWVLFAVEEGTFEYQIGENYGVAEFGDVVVCPPQIAFHRNVLTPLSFHSITFLLPEGEPLKLQPLLAQRKIRLPQIRRLSENYSCLRQADQQMSYSSDNQKLKQHYLADLWLMIAQQALESPEVDPLLEKDEFIRDVALYLNNHAHESIEIRDVAQRFGMTPVQLIRRFKNAYGVNPLQYLTSIRVKQACRLLLITEWTLDVIAGRCGYENGFYLSRVFRKAMGVSPSEFRKQYRY
ncbi:helix-turn-helix domain-containing protein [Paenibacillus flagellatus]|uniref:AraC family transcriptional regulator n=1 Tax=Paenibacillus flagellatus TaxID=2211139 RepID=A0A2V5JXH3_9BACL|nr:AraC family transcriptional regulator [Paenibacillus flagellatus]PYI51539.1 AraC family transcriptional regulator [Paenibacillus flagellatus]